MKIYNILLSSFLLLLVNNAILPQSFINITPKNNSFYVSLSNNIILRCDKQVDPSSLSQDEFIVMGNISGKHVGKVKISDNNRTILFLPENKFAPDEEVNVTITPGIKSIEGENYAGTSFHFRTTRLLQNININSLSLSDNLVPSENGTQSVNSLINSRMSTDSLPSNFPTITIGTSNNPSTDGKLFITNQPSGAANKSIGNYLMILNNDGTPVKYMSLSQASNLFKMEPNGLPSFNYRGSGNRIIMDTAFTAIDSFQCGNGYSTDGHDFLLLPNGHALVFGGDPQPVDMSQIVPGGNPNAIVTGAVVQEIDESHNVVFQWRSWDYLSITDSYFDLTSASIDLIHPNSITVDNDGNILFSMRHYSSIIKIDRNTGNIDWTLGGKQNQFTFINENEANSPTYFSYQHDISMLPNGNLTLFDNGNQHPVNYSRGVEYQLDQINKTATLVWEYRHSPDLYSSAMGSVQRLPNGNTIIGWGLMSVSGSPVLTEVHPDKSIALELFLPVGQISYRALKYPWVSEIPEADVTVFEILPGNTYTFTNTTDTTGIKIKFTALNAAPYTNAIINKYNYAPINPVFVNNVPRLYSYCFNIAGPGINSYTGEVHVSLSRFPNITDPKETIVYGMSSTSGIFTAQSTSYDSVNGELVFTTSMLGQFAFGVPQTVSAFSPIPFSPQNNEIVNGESNVRLMWGTRGIVQSYRVQVAADSLFASPVLDNANLSSTSLTVGPLNNNSTYYWRVNNTNSIGTSEWSSFSKFLTASPFIKVLYPNGGNNIFNDSTYIIRWLTNVSDPLKIMLYKNNGSVSTIADSVVSGTDAYLWQVSSSLPMDSTYKILITSISNISLNDSSDNTFIIQPGVTGISETTNLIKDYSLFQNYPNPFNPSTIIRYSIPVDGMVSIDVFNVIGQKITSLENSVKKAGEYEVQWNAANLPSGMYLYRITAAGTDGKNFTMSKKMLLLK